MLGPRLEILVRHSIPVYCACRACAVYGATEIRIVTGTYVAVLDTLWRKGRWSHTAKVTEICPDLTPLRD